MIKRNKPSTEITQKNCFLCFVPLFYPLLQNITLQWSLQPCSCPFGWKHNQHTNNPWKHKSTNHNMALSSLPFLSPPNRVLSVSKLSWLLHHKPIITWLLYWRFFFCREKTSTSARSVMRCSCLWFWMTLMRQKKGENEKAHSNQVWHAAFDCLWLPITSTHKKRCPNDGKKDSEQPDLNQRPKDISFPTTVFRYYQLSYARFTYSRF